MFRHRLLDYILACHPPTFVRSKRVALPTKRFCVQLMKVNPALLAGTFGLGELNEASGGLEQLPELAYEGGLYHDLGKCMLLNYVGCYSCNLLDAVMPLPRIMNGWWMNCVLEGRQICSRGCRSA